MSICSTLLRNKHGCAEEMKFRIAPHRKKSRAATSPEPEAWFWVDKSRCVMETSFRAIQFQRMELLSSYDSISTKGLDFISVLLLFYPSIFFSVIFLLFTSGPSSVFNFIIVRGRPVLSMAFTTAGRPVRDPGRGSGEKICFYVVYTDLFSLGHGSDT
jgi:hypothetical protein